jgi:hypothetical protein
MHRAPVASLQSWSPLSLVQPGGQTPSEGPQFRWHAPWPLQVPSPPSQATIADLLPVTTHLPPLAQSILAIWHSFGAGQSVGTQSGTHRPPEHWPAGQAAPLLFSQAVPLELHLRHWPQVTQHSFRSTHLPPPQLLPVWTQFPF